MKTTINQDGSRYEVAIKGRIDTVTANEFQASIAPLLEADKPEIIIDCTELEYTSSQGLRSFLMLQKSVNAHSGSLKLTNMKPQVKEVFDITGFSSIIKIV